MKKYFVLATLMLSTSLLAAGPQFQNLTEADVKEIGREFSGTFSHTGVSAPETDGLWGVEVGLLAGQSSSPKLSDIVKRSGGNGDDFENLYHAGLVARAHFPFDLFAEISLLPEQDISDTKIKNTTFEIGWNFGRFVGLPLDIAFGANFGNSELGFTQPASGAIPAADISMKSKSNIVWVGVSKSFIFVTPYFKLGKAKADTELTATSDIFTGPESRSFDVSNDGSYMAVGLNFNVFILKFGAEYSQIMDVKRTSAKLSLDF